LIVEAFGFEFGSASWHIERTNRKKVVKKVKHRDVAKSQNQKKERADPSTTRKERKETKKKQDSDQL
jgi:hypothetical protein